MINKLDKAPQLLQVTIKVPCQLAAGTIYYNNLKVSKDKAIKIIEIIEGVTQQVTEELPKKVTKKSPKNSDKKPKKSDKENKSED
jgi:hypothetical protein